MARTQIQFPEPLYQRLKEIAKPLRSWAAKTTFGFLHIIAARLALSLLQQGIAEFATANAKHFEVFGFEKVWNPVSS